MEKTTVFERGSDCLVVRVTDDPMSTGVPTKGEFWVAKSTLASHTTLLDQHELDNGELILDDWSIPALSLWFHLLHEADVEPDMSNMDGDPRNMWFFVSFFNMYMDQDHDSFPSRLMSTCCSTYDQVSCLRIPDRGATDLYRLLVPAFHIGDAKIFIQMTRDWYMHVTGAETNYQIVDESGKGVLTIDKTMLGE